MSQEMRLAPFLLRGVFSAFNICHHSNRFHCLDALSFSSGFPNALRTNSAMRFSSWVRNVPHRGRFPSKRFDQSAIADILSASLDLSHMLLVIMLSTMSMLKMCVSQPLFALYLSIGVVQIPIDRYADRLVVSGRECAVCRFRI